MVTFRNLPKDSNPLVDGLFKFLKEKLEDALKDIDCVFEYSNEQLQLVECKKEDEDKIVETFDLITKNKSFY